jgi:hypothetical protein
LPDRLVLRLTDVRRLGQLDPALADRVHHRPSPVRRAELVEDRGDVVLDGLLAEVQLDRDLAVAEPARDDLEDLALPARERVLRRRVESERLTHLLDDPAHDVGPPGQLGEELILAVRDAPDRVDDLRRVGDLRDVARRADLDGADDARVVVVAAQDDHRRAGRLVMQPTGRLRVRRLGQVAADQDDVRCRRLDDAACLLGRSHLGDHLDSVLAVEDLADRDPQERLGLDHDDPDRVVRRAGGGPSGTHGTSSAGPARGSPP